MKLELTENLESGEESDTQQETEPVPDQMTSQSDDGDNSIGLVSALFYIIVIVAIGVPVWYRTTSPSRYNLPDVASLMVHLQTTVSAVDISVVVNVDLDKDSLAHQLPKNHISSDGGVAFNIDWRVRKMTSEEESVWSKSKSLETFDRDLGKLESHQKPGRLYIFLVDMNFIRKLGAKVIVLGSNRFVYIGVHDEEMGVIEADEEKSIVMLILDALEAVLEAKPDSPLLTSTDLEEKENIKYLINRELDVIVNFISENMEDSSDYRTRQMILNARKLGEETFIQKSGISNVIWINFMSQMVYNCFDSSFIESNLINSNDLNRKERLFDQSRVSVLLNSIESRIIEPNTKTSYHLHVIIPSSSRNESVYFYDKSTKSKSFAVSTSHGAGIFFWNKENDFNLAFKSFMRNLMGLSSIQPTNSISRNIFFTKWELDYLIRRMTLQHLSKTLSSLESLDKLLIKVENIVILKEISDKMNLAAGLSHKSIDLLAQGNLLKAYELSGKAFSASESAFFDPSLLSRLYFPEDQKYAVYFPLFLPMSVPLVLSLYQIIKRRMARKEHEKCD